MENDLEGFDPKIASRIGARQSLDRLPLPATAKWPDGVCDFPVLERGDGTSVLFFAPRDVDHQSAHDRDEFYVVVAGSGMLEAGADTIAYEPGDLLYVPKLMAHRFIDPPHDLALWVFFVPTVNA